MAWTDVKSWEPVGHEQVLQEMSDGSSPVTDKDGAPGSALSIRSRIKPVDLYSHLIARFGEPNGKQSLLLSMPIDGTPTPNSGNIVHWDFELYSGDTRIMITGLTREIHVFVSRQVEDDEWLLLIRNLKIDFGVHAKAKSAIQARFEKWIVFANPFAAIAEACAGLHERIVDAQEIRFSFQAMGDEGFNSDDYQKQLNAAAERANGIYADCLQLRMLTPVLGEAFINMLTALTAKADLRDDPNKWLAYRKSAFHSKLENLAEDCDGFSRPLDTDSETYKKFMRIRSRRNDLLHANVLPEADKLELVYFDDKTPLHAEAGDIFQRFWEQYEAWVNPQGAIDDYEDVHLFCIEIENHLEPQLKREARLVVEEKFPGYDQSRKRFGILWPDHLVHFMTGPQFIRYDDQLEDFTAS